MTSALFEVNKKYWTDRAPSYSQVNQEELAGCQRSNWLREISRQIQMVYPNRAPQEITVLDAGTGPGFFAVILAEAGYKVTAIDAASAMLAEAKRNAGPWQEAIDFSMVSLLDKNYISENYIQAIKDSTINNGPYYILAPGVAMPHARPECGALKTGMSLTLLE